jgi:predicted nucleic acid-binding Zn ribbon protein
MFRRDVKKLDDVLARFLRVSGLETPLLQRRLIDSWGEVMGPVIAKYTEQVFISNQTLMVKINNSALRAELSMMRTQIVRLLNDHIGVMVIADVKLY